MKMSMREYKELAAARKSEVKALFMAAMDGLVPEGYVLSDDPRQMYVNALLRMKPEMPNKGMFSLTFLHQLEYRNVERVGDGYEVTASTESVLIEVGVYQSPSTVDSETTGVRPWRFRVSGGDLAAAVREAVSTAMSQPPFTQFEWRKYEHDKERLELYDGEKRLGKIWKSGGKWATLMGNSFKTQNQAKVESEGSEAAIIATKHQERLAGLSVPVGGVMRGGA